MKIVLIFKIALKKTTLGFCFTTKAAAFDLIVTFESAHCHLFLLSSFQNPPNFLVASELHRHERLEVVVPEAQPDPEPEVDSLIDTAEPPQPVSTALFYLAYFTFDCLLS